MAEKEWLYLTGRVVQGSVLDIRKVTYNGKPKLDDNGVQAEEYFMALAVPKNDPGMLATQARIEAIASAGFPGGEATWPTFSWKRMDGDVPPHNTKEGFPGHYVYRFRTGRLFPPKAYTKGGESQIIDPRQIRCGYYARVVFYCEPNGNADKPGVYLNHAIVELVGYGEEINSGPDAAALLGAAGPAAMPAGASAAPVAGGAPIQPPAAQIPAGSGPNQMYGLNGGPTPAGRAPAGQPVPPTPITPAPDFLTPPVLTEKAGGMSYQQMIDAGWTDELLKQHGYLA